MTLGRASLRAQLYVGEQLAKSLSRRVTPEVGAFACREAEAGALAGASREAPALAVHSDRSSGVNRDDRLGGSAVLATVAVGEGSHGQRRLSVLARIQPLVLLALGYP